MPHGLILTRIHSFSSWRSTCWPQSLKMSRKITLSNKITVIALGNLKNELSKYIFFNMRQILSPHRSFEIHRFSQFWWYRFQNSITVRDIGLKFYMVIELGKLEDLMQVFLRGSVHTWREFLKTQIKTKNYVKRSFIIIYDSFESHTG
jgi:hypothetical protein